jgi:hypothetical protein
MMKYFLAGTAILILIVCQSCRDSKGDTDTDFDSLFLGTYLGMEKREFFEHCWEMNRQKKFIHGPTNQSVEYQIANELDYPVMMRFYPSFHENRIYEMPVTFNYEGWAPWNKQFSSDTLLVEMLGVFKRWYGDDFKELEHDTMGKVYYKMDGKRRINLFRKDDQYVQAVFTDMKVEKQIKEEKEKLTQN